MIAKVLVDVKSKNVDKLYDYSIPGKYDGILQVGSRVIVPFGFRKVMGYCLEIVKDSNYDKELKDIERIIDVESYLNQELIELARVISDETGYVLISVLETILPSALKVMYKPKIEVLDLKKLNHSLKPFFKNHHERYLEEIDDDLYALVLKEIKAGVLKQNYEIKKRNKSLSKRFVQLLTKDRDKLTEKQKLVYDYLTQRKDKVDLQQIIVHHLNITSSVLKTMEKHRLVKVFNQEVMRKVETIYQKPHNDVDLNQEQKEVYNVIQNNLNKQHTILLHGVTGSGKTEIYMKAINEVIERGQTVILLVPEISLTPMMIQRFKSRFKHLVATIHSGLSKMEKYDEWRRIIRKEARIVIGARSACFAPLVNIGLMIVDESHESSYKQTDHLPYYAVDILKKRSKTHQALLLLGSATPNIESYARVSRGHYQLLELKNRALNSKMPTINLVNMVDEFKAGHTEDISRSLINAIKLRLDNNQQVILLINRRGYSNFLMCRECGHVFKCKNCDISLTYHKHTNSLKCHYCSYEEALPRVCENCGSKSIEYMGSGTQKIENDLNELFPDAKVFRMDTDTTSRKHSHEKLLHSFQEKGDILIGTQMIAKGLDFPKVTLVGILQADGNLFVPDFRAPEKTFQLIMQVSGRSGRRDTLGEVIIQAYNPEHYAVKYAYENDYHGFYEHEMRLRRIARYSPFYFLVRLDITGNSINHILTFAVQVVKDLRRELSTETIILGPSSDVKKINNKYTTSIMIKYKKEPEINHVMKKVVNKYIEKDILIRVDRFPGVG
ncbi:MAG: primosomal protein N' [Tenericutes bacterium]|jgi:primosomal protein N' (replication factor Y)|nr:primosomal protein N' [Mycoplasmatota bacterium]